MEQNSNSSWTRSTDLAAALLALGCDTRDHNPVTSTHVAGKPRPDYTFYFEEDSTEFDAGARKLIAAWLTKTDLSLDFDHLIDEVERVANASGNPDVVREVNKITKLLPFAIMQYIRAAMENRTMIATWIIKVAEKGEVDLPTFLQIDEGNRTHFFDKRLSAEKVKVLRETPLPRH